LASVVFIEGANHSPEFMANLGAPKGELDIDLSAISRTSGGCRNESEADAERSKLIS
jgi:hypothetical protein